MQNAQAQQENELPRITYVDFRGGAQTVEVPVGYSVMEGAIRNNIPGIVAECGGACACATCHVYVDEKWLDRMEPMGDVEGAMLEFAPQVTPASRLSCQIRVTESLDGLVVQTPENQG